MSITETDASAFKKSFPQNLVSTLEPTVTSNESYPDLVIEDENSKDGKFTERTQFLIEPNEYPRNKRNPGLILIFNQERCIGQKIRHGSKRDVNEIVTCFGRLGYNININNIYNDFTTNKIIDLIDKVTQADLSEVNCLILFFLTHGKSNNYLDTKDTMINSNEILKKFAACKDLENKPKMFVFQACKGIETSSTDKIPNVDNVQIVANDTFKPNYIGKDMIILCSSTEGNVSYRNTTVGSWFIQELCKNFLAYGRRDDVISLIIRTTKCVCRNYYHQEKSGIEKQMPMFISTLTKKFYLNRSKERHFLIDLQNKYETLHEELKALKTKVDVLYRNYEKQNKKK